MKMRQEVISGSFLLEGLPWILQQLPHSSEGCGQQGLHGGIWSGERQWAHRFPRCRPRGSPGPWLDCLSKCWAERELPGVFMSSWRVWGDGNHRTDRGLFIWWLTCLFLLPLEFVKARSMGQSSTYRLNTWMAGVGVGRGGGEGWDQATRGVHSTSKHRELGSVCLYSAGNDALGNPVCWPWTQDLLSSCWYPVMKLGQFWPQSGEQTRVCQNTNLLHPLDF